ncbi:MAG: autotransporter domain-containing protein [Fusobacterium sp.]
MKQELENSVKRFLKRKVKVTLGFMVAFMISGSIGYAESIIPKSEDTEVLLFMNGTFREFDNEEIKDIGEFRLVQGQEVIKPPVIDEPTVPDKPVDPDKPTDPEKPTDPDKPTEPEKPGETIPWEDLVPATKVNTENKVQENTNIFTIKDKEAFTNKGDLTLKSDVEMLDTNKDHIYDTPNNSYAVIENNGGKVINEGNINVEGLKEVNVAGTGHIVKVGEGVGVHQTSGSFENNGTITVAGNGFDGDNDGYIETNGGIGVLVEGGTAVNKNTITSPDSYLLPDKGLMLGRGIGMKALNGTIENADGGLIKNQAISMLAEDKGIAVNNGTIETEQVGLMALNGGTATNNGTINAWKNEKEGHKGEAGIGLYASSFNGAETVVTNNETGIVYGSVKAEGTNAKVINNGTIYGTEIKVTNGVIENNGTITGEATKPVIDIEGGKFVQSVNGKLEAEKVNGDVYLAGDYGKNNFEDKVSVEGLDIKEHNGEVKSNSVMYDYNSADKSLERKEFSDIMANQEFASYLEDNYLDGDIIRQELYNNLKLIDNVKEFNRATNNLFGNDIYPSLKKQTFDMIRFNKNTLVENVFETEANKEWRVIGGADYTNIEANPSNLAGYDTDIKSVFVGADKEINSNHRLGGVLNVGTLKSDFDMNNARREDTFVQGNIYSIYNYNGIQFINNFFLGLSEGDLERDLKFGDVEGRQKGDIDTNYLGLNNIVTKKFDFDNSIYLKPKAEFNITQLQMGDIKEDGNYGLVVDKQDVTSIEAGIGLEAGKHFDLTDTLVGTVKVYGNYLAELSDPYEEMEVKLRRIDYSDTVKLSDYDDEDYKDLGIRFELSNESVTTYVEYNYTFEDDFFTAGINYKF